MLGTILFKLVRSSDGLRERLWKLAYETFPKVLPDADWWFMNYGYEPSDAERYQFGTLDEQQFQWRSRAMYHYLAARAQVAGKDVLEVGSGRGGGLRHVAETMHTASATGLDFAASAIAFCQKNHTGTSARYVEGNSMDMPFESETFDVVLNVESCHAYRDQAQFLREVVRVLRPGGTLHLVDVRALWNWDLLYQWLNEAGLELLENVDISPNVVTAIERDEPTKKALIKKRVPFWLRGMFTEFAGNVGSQLYERLNNGEIQYRRIVARRPA